MFQNNTVSPHIDLYPYLSSETIKEEEAILNQCKESSLDLEVSIQPSFSDSFFDQLKGILLDKKSFDSLSFSQGSQLNNDRVGEKLAEILNSGISYKHLKIKKINLSNTALQIISESISKQHNLISLTFNKCQICDACFSCIFDSIIKLTSLEKLDLSGNFLNSETARMLTDALSQGFALKDLNLSSNNISDNGVEYISRALKVNSFLERLNLAKNGIGNQNSISIGIHTSRNYVPVKRPKKTSVEMLAEALFSNKSLKVLNLSSNPIQFSGAEAFSIALRRNEDLTALDLSRTQIGSKGIRILQEMLSDRPTKLLLSVDSLRPILHPKYKRALLMPYSRC